MEADTPGWRGELARASERIAAGDYAGARELYESALRPLDSLGTGWSTRTRRGDAHGQPRLGSH